MLSSLKSSTALAVVARLSVRNKNAVSAHQKWIAVLTQVIKFEAFLGEVNTYYFRDFLNILVGVAPTNLYPRGVHAPFNLRF